MPSFVAELEPEALFRHFDRLLEIPRPSGREEAARAYVLELARERGLVHRQDAAGNVVVELPATPGREAAAPLALQAHLDMVCEKNADVEFDFARDPIRPRWEGDWLTASGTTLGADNGIGVAAMLAVMTEPQLPHGPLELLFTVEEETGLVGASKLDPALVRARRLLNLDTEEEGSIYIGCAGGAGTDLEIPLDEMFGAEGRGRYLLAVEGLAGGHSGVDIHLGRGNAIALLARILWATWPEHQFELAGIEGGNLHNAIPREARARIRVARGDEGALERDLRREEAAIQAELQGVDDGFRVRLERDAEPAGAFVWTEATIRRVVPLLVALPHGVLVMSRDLPGLVETSANLARVRTEGNVLRIHQSSRSSIDSALRATQRRIEACAELAGGSGRSSEGYPGWKPDLSSPLLSLLREVYCEVTGRDAELKAIHAGLECGVLKAKLPGLDCASIGPRIEFPHSPGERVDIPSVSRFYRLLVESLDALSRPGGS